jgi:hypothetical protein
MSYCQDILCQLDKGVPPQQIASRLSWSVLSVEDRACLLNEAERRCEDKTSPEILRALYLMCRDSDPWNALRVLGLIVGRSALLVTPKQKQAALGDMQRYLNRIRESLSATSVNDIHRYKHYEADYYVLRAKISLESQELVEAKRLYQEAMGIYQEYGIIERVNWAQQQIARIQEMENRQQQLLPLLALESEHIRRQTELSSLVTKVNEQQQVLGMVQAEIDQARENRTKLLAAIQADIVQAQADKDEALIEYDRLAKQIADQQMQLRALEVKIEEAKQRRQKLDDQIHQHQVVLDFFSTLPRVAMAPLWVEVTRMALAQGEMDDLTQQALVRLSIAFPVEVIPLLAEIATRSGESEQANVLPMIESYWMTLLVQARNSHGQNPMTAAQKLVEAWDGFFRVARQDVYHV